MARKGDIVRYTDKALAAKRARGESRTDWQKVDGPSEAQLRASIAADPDDVQGEPDWTLGVSGLPPHKDHINIRIDHDVLEWFRATGKGYQTLMNNVLRAFVQTRRRPKQGRRAAK
jgi:uncharacterized protein (DUF4415 family)